MSRYIDADAIKGKAWKAESEACFYALEDVVSVTDIDEAPSIDIVRCKECKYGEYREDFDDYECHSSGCGLVYDADFFCADGERKESER